MDIERQPVLRRALGIIFIGFEVYRILGQIEVHWMAILKEFLYETSVLHVSRFKVEIFSSLFVCFSVLFSHIPLVNTSCYIVRIHSLFQQEIIIKKKNFFSQNSQYFKHSKFVCLYLTLINIKKVVSNYN